MIPLYLRLKHFIGIKKGLGINEVEIDFSKYYGLVALSGPNGFGKTTVLEMMSPYSRFVSRDLNHLADNVFSREAEKEYHFKYNGSVYKTLIKIDNHSRKLEGYIWKDEEPVVSGKISEYDKYITNLMGTSNLFYNSVFTAQNATKLSEMNETPIRTLLREFVGADRLEKQSKTCGEVSKYFKSKLKQLEEDLLKFSAKIQEVDDLKESCLSIEENLDEKNDSLVEVEKEIKKKHDIIDSLYKKQSEQDLNIEKVKSLKDILEVTAKQRESLSKKNKDDLEIIESQLKTLDLEIKAHNTVIASKEKLESNKEDIRSVSKIIEVFKISVAELNDKNDKIQINIDSVNTEIKSINDKIKILTSEKDERLKDYHVKREELSKLTIDNINCEKSKRVIDLQETIESCKKQTELLSKKPDNCEDHECKFIKSALESQKTLEESERELPIATISLFEAKEEFDETKKALDLGMGLIKEKGVSLARDIEDLEIKLDKRKENLVGFKTNIFHNKNSIESDQKTIDDHTENIARIQTEINKYDEKEIAVSESKLKDLQKQVIEINDNRDKLNISFISNVSSLDNDSYIIENKINRFPETDFTIDKQLKEVQARQTELGDQFQLLNASILEYTSQHKAQNMRIESLEKEMIEKADIENNISYVKNEIGLWEFIKIQTGAKGLQAVEINESTPLIIENTNRLLRSSFGSGFSVKINMQDEDGKEIFEILVIDEDGEETHVGNKSGGESVWILKAMRFSMSLISKEKSGFVFETAFSDEETGSLDKEKSEDLIKLFRAFMVEGGFKSKYFISHSEDIVSLADHTINFSKKGIQVI